MIDFFPLSSQLELTPDWLVSISVFYERSTGKMVAIATHEGHYGGDLEVFSLVWHTAQLRTESRHHKFLSFIIPEQLMVTSFME